MSDQNFRNGFINSDTVERSDHDSNSPVGISDLNPAHDPVEAVLPVEPSLQETLTVAPLVDDMAVQMAPQSETVTLAAPVAAKGGSPAALLDQEVSEHFRTRWNEIQGKFVDEPRSAVQEADALVSEVVGQITQMFSSEHSSLEGQWNQGNDVSTEDLRMALQRYRAFFNRLVV